MEALPNGSTTSDFKPLENAQVWIASKDENVTLHEYRPGLYLFPDNFKGQPGRPYTLHFDIDQRGKFRSITQVMPSEVKIDSVFHIWNDEAINEFGKTSPGHEIFINTRDNPDSVNFYQWNWRLYETQNWCLNCPPNTLYFPDPNPKEPGECVYLGNDITIPSFDYQCSGPCWDIYPSRDILTFSDEYSNGGMLEHILVAEIPFIQRKAALVDIIQLGISKEFHHYLDLVKKQTQETGGLADTPPVTLYGNIENLEDSDHVIAGYFVVASADKRMYWLDRTDAAAGFSPIGVLNGRIPRPEVGYYGFGMIGVDRPPLAPCLESDYRTPTRPEGWKF